MKLLFVYQNYRNSYTGIAKSFRKAFSNTSIPFSEFEFKPFSRSFNLNRIANKIKPINSWHFNTENERLLNFVKSYKPTHIFVLKGTDLHPNTISYIKSIDPELSISCFNPDNPFNTASSNNNIRASIKFYNHYFIWTKRLFSSIKEAGAEEVHYLPFAADLDLIHPAKPFKEIVDIGFIGNGDEERSRWMNELDYQLKLKDINNLNVSIFGYNWNAMDNIVVEGQMNGENYLSCLASTKVNINLLREQNKGSINMRTFELPAAGAFMLHENSSEAKEFFAEDKEACYFSDAEELLEKAIFYSKNDFKRLKIAEAGNKKIYSSKYDYNHIIKQLLQIIK